MEIGSNLYSVDNGGNVLKLLRKGAEAYLYKDEWFGKSVMIKKRIPKKYRNEKLDLKIRSLRTISEGKLLTEARKVGVLTPFVYEIDPNNYSITMDFINGPRLKEALNQVSEWQDILERKDIQKRISYLIIIGLTRDLTREEREALLKFNKSRKDLTVVTWDYIIENINKVENEVRRLLYRNR